MKRRDFLKRAVGVVAGATVVPAVLKTKDKPKGLSANDICNEALSKIGKYSLGTRRVDACGRVFRYCQVKESGFVMQNGQAVSLHRDYRINA